jgi:hypothetical protein
MPRDYGTLLGLSGVIDTPGGSAKFEVIDIERFTNAFTERVIDATGFGDAGEQKYVAVTHGGYGSLIGSIRTSDDIGLANLGDYTNGTGTMTIKTGSKRKMSGPVILTNIQVTRNENREDHLRVAMQWRKNGAWTEAAA